MQQLADGGINIPDHLIHFPLRRSMMRSTALVPVLLLCTILIYAARGEQDADKLQFELINATIAHGRPQVGPASQLQATEAQLDLPFTLELEQTLDQGRLRSRLRERLLAITIVISFPTIAITSTATDAAFHNVALPMPADLERPVLRSVATLAPSALLQQFTLQAGEVNTGMVNASLTVTGAPADAQLNVEVPIHQEVVLPVTLYFSVSGSSSQQEQGALVQLLEARGFDGEVHGMDQDSLVVSVQAKLTIQNLPGGILGVCAARLENAA